MFETEKRKFNTLKWIARIWSLIPIFFALGHIFEDETTITEEVYFSDYMLLTLLGIYIIGLVISWRWEYIGGLISSITMAVFLVLFWIFVESIFSATLVFLLGAFPPALFFLYYGWEKRKHDQNKITS